jgi:hypothetical protein
MQDRDLRLFMVRLALQVAPRIPRGDVTTEPDRMPSSEPSVRLT